MNNESTSLKDDWQQIAEDVAACACHVICALTPDDEKRQEFQKQLLRAEARVLRGLLAFVEGRLSRMNPPEAAQPEKIRIQ